MVPVSDVCRRRARITHKVIHSPCGSFWRGPFKSNDLPVVARIVDEEPFESRTVADAGRRTVSSPMTIARVALPVARREPFDYWAPSGVALEAGDVVRVRLGGRALVGVVVGTADSSDVAPERLSPIAEIVSGLRMPNESMGLAEFVARYYQEPLGLVLAAMLPPLGRSGATRPARA